jgi:hypothetical protein
LLLVGGERIAKMSGVAGMRGVIVGLLEPCTGARTEQMCFSRSDRGPAGDGLRVSSGDKSTSFYPAKIHNGRSIDVAWRLLMC